MQNSQLRIGCLSTLGIEFCILNKASSLEGSHPSLSAVIRRCLVNYKIQIRNNEKVPKYLHGSKQRLISCCLISWSIELCICRPGHHRPHGKQGMKGMVVKLSIAVVVLLICTISLLLSVTTSGSNGYASEVSDVSFFGFGSSFHPNFCYRFPSMSLIFPLQLQYI